MKPRDANDHSITARHPLDVMNVPNPDDQEVLTESDCKPGRVALRKLRWRNQ